LSKEHADLIIANQNEIKQLKDKHVKQLQELENVKTGLDVDLDNLKNVK